MSRRSKKSDPYAFSIDMVSHTERVYKDTATTGALKYIQYGLKDDLPEYLNEIFESSPIHGALVNSISDMIYGQGLMTENGQEPDGRIAEWLDKVTFGQDGQDALKYICHDIKKNGISFVEVIRGQGQIATLFRSEPEKWRLSPKNEQREIESVWYSEDFTNPYGQTKPVEVPTWKPGSTEQRSVLVISLPSIGRTYYPRPDYWGCAKYAELDKEIGTFHLNHILNGMSPSMAINFNNGIPETKEKRDAIKREVTKKLQGTNNAGKILVTFNEGKDRAAEFTTFDLSEAHLQYDQLARTVVHQILLGHRVISPMLHGVRDYGTGFSNNSEEMEMATRLFERNVINNFRDVIQKALWPVFEEMGMTERLYFTSPVLAELDEEEPEVIEEELSAYWETPLSEALELSDAIQTIPESWDLVSAEKVDDDGKYKLDLKKRVEGFILALFDNRSSIQSKPQEDSEQDSGAYKVRYAYMPTIVDKDIKGGSRDFCEAMVSITRRGGVFRYEDIQAMSQKGVNKNLGHKGQPYSLWLHKGGVNCKHFWERRIYKDTVSKEDRISVNEARREGFRPEPNDPKVAQRQWDRKDKGHHPNYKG